MSTIALVCFLGAAPFALALMSALMSALIRRDWIRAVPMETGPTGASGAPGSPLEGASVERIDLSRLLPALAEAARPLARTTGTRIGLAVSPGGDPDANPAMLAAALRQILDTAIRSAPGGMVLVSACAHGGETHIAVTDDGPALDRSAREAAAQKSSRAFASRGGSATVETRGEYGTTVTLRLRAATRPVDPRAPATPRTPVMAAQSA